MKAHNEYPSTPLQKQHLSILNAFSDRHPRALTATSAPSLISWAPYYDFRIFENENFTVIYSGKLDAFLFPFGDPQKGLSYIINTSDDVARIVFADEAQCEELERAGWAVHVEEKHSEYIYDSRALALEGPNVSKNLKRKYKKFAKTFSYEILPLSEERIAHYHAAILGMENIEADYGAALTLLKNHRDLGISGIELRCAEDFAFILGYQNTKDIFTMSFVDYSDGFGPNAVAACICELAKQICNVYSYIDLEEDMGIEGLRKMKELYLPLFMLEAKVAEHDTKRDR